MANKTENISAFLGLNLRDRIGQGELSRTHNCSARRYPLLTSRSPRDILSKIEIPAVSSCVANNALYFTQTAKDTQDRWFTSLYKVIEGETLITFSLSGPATWYYYLPNTNNERKTGGSWAVDYSTGALMLYDCGILDVTEAYWAAHESTTWNKAEHYHFEWGWDSYNVPRLISFTSSDIFDPTCDVRLSVKFAEKIYSWYNGTADCDIKSPYGEDITMLSMGANILIFPAGYYYNTQTGVGGEIYRFRKSSSTNYYQVIPCDIEGKGMGATISSSQPSVSSYPAYWVDTSGTEDKLKENEGDGTGWHELAADYTCIRYYGALNDVGDLSYFNIGDCINLTFTSGDNLTKNDIPGINYVINRHRYNSSVVAERYSALLINGKVFSSDTHIIGNVVRTLPRMDYVCECDNRLWGVAKDTNEIYACALGNFFNWSYYQGISTDPWTVLRGCPGYWTGCINYLGTPTFFKESYIECVYPASSGAHQTSTLNINGTGPTAPRSIAMVDNIVYWQSTTGFYMYSGSLPKKISYNLAENIYTDSVGGDLAGFYYVSCKDQNGDVHLLVFDVDNNAWYEEDDKEAVCMCRVNSRLFIFTTDGMFATTGGDEVVQWSAITGDLGINAYNGYGAAGGFNTYDDKYPEKLHIRTSGAKDESIEAYIEYDGNGKWEYIGTLANNGTHRYSTYPFVPRRCDHFRLKFNGIGNSAVWGIDIEYATGGATR